MRSLIYVILLIALSICRLAQCAAPVVLFETNRVELWSLFQHKAETGKAAGLCAYIDDVPSIRLTSVTTPHATALANVLQYLNARKQAPLHCFSPEVMQSFEKDVLAKIAPSLKGSDEVSNVLLMERLGNVIQDLAAEDSFAGLPTYGLKEWMQTAPGDKTNPVASRGIQRSYLLGQQFVGKSGDIKEIASGLMRFGTTRFQKIMVTITERVKFQDYKAALDAHGPVMLKVGKAFVTGIGYWRDGHIEYLLVHDPVTSEIRVAKGGDGALHADDYGGQITECLIPGLQFVKMNNLNSDASMLAFTNWQQSLDDVCKPASENMKGLSKP